jgi:hypothetical protein
MKERNVKLPNDMLEIAKQGGLRLACLNAYASSHVSFLLPLRPAYMESQEKSFSS